MAAQALKAGARVGPYELVAPIGAGGMGEVWKARDTRLDRTVAIKFSQAEFNDRFAREARAIAALNHPNIAQIYDVGENYIVMEFIDGEPLRKPDTTRKLLDIAVQIADGLAGAHAAGFVHRDLKPDNILLTRDGRIKILDFGLAKQAAAAASPDEATRTIAVTNPGTVLGTVAYMSPEQARAQQLDARSDQFSFGLILYELATGRRAFQRASAAETMTAIIREEPDPLPGNIPAPLRWTIQRCLSKDATERYDTTRDLYLDLRTIRERLTETSGAEIVPLAPPRQSPLKPALLLAAAALSFAGLLALGWAHFREAPPAAPAPVRFEFSAPAGVVPHSTFAISPDGRRVAYIAQDADQVQRVWLYDLRSAESHPVPGTEKMAGSPVSFSPDGRFLFVQVGTTLKRFDLAGGVPSVLADVRIAVGITWNGDETILFGSGGTGPIQRLSTRDGSVAPVTKLIPEQGFTGDLMPWFLPDGKNFLYLRRSNVPENYGVYAGSIETAPERQTQQVVATKLGAIYVPAEGTAAKSGRGFLIFQREHTLLAQPFAPRRLRPSGDPIRLAEGVGYRLDSGFFDATPEILIYRGDPDPKYQLTWLDAGGKPVGVAGEVGGYTTAIGAVAISPDGKRAVVSRLDGESRDLWVLDFARGTSARLTYSGGDRTAVWSRDGTQVAFRSNRKGAPGLYKKTADGSDEEVKLLASNQTINPTSWSPDGRFLLYDVRQENTGAFDMWILPLADRKPRRLLAPDYDEGQGVFSPDGRWIAYLSNESGREEVYVTAFLPDGSIKGKWVVSRGVLSWTPHWQADSKELQYVSADSSLMSVAISPGAEFQAGPPVTYGKAPGRNYGAFAPDGKRLLVPMPAGKVEPARFTVVLHWQSGLK